MDGFESWEALTREVPAAFRALADTYEAFARDMVLMMASAFSRPALCAAR